MEGGGDYKITDKILPRYQESQCEPCHQKKRNVIWEKNERT